MATLLAEMADLARGERIKALRGRQTQPAIVEALEEKAGRHVITLRGYQVWEAGGGIKWDNVKLLAAVHDVEPSYIMGDDEEDDPKKPKGSPDVLGAMNGNGAAMSDEQLERLADLVAERTAQRVVQLLREATPETDAEEPEEPEEPAAAVHLAAPPLSEHSPQAEPAKKPKQQPAARRKRAPGRPASNT